MNQSIQNLFKDKKLFLIWYRDLNLLKEILQTDFINWLKWKNDKYVFVPMDEISLGFLMENNFNWIFPDTGIDQDTLNLGFIQAEKLNYKWVSCYNYNSVSSLMYKSIEYQLITIFTSEILARHWKACHVKEVSAIHREKIGTYGYWHNGDLPQCVFLDILGNLYKPTRENSLRKAFNKNIVYQKNIIEKINKLLNIKSRLNQSYGVNVIDNNVTEGYKCLSKAIVYMSIPDYIYRDLNYIKQLEKIAPVYLLWQNIPKTLATDIPKIILLNREPYSRKDDSVECVNHLMSLLKKYPNSAKILGFYVLENHFINMEYVEWIKKVFSKYTPKLVCSTQNADVILRYLELACVDLNIPVLGLPHATVQEPRSILWERQHPYAYIASYKLNSFIANETALSVRTCSVKNIFVENEYPTTLYYNQNYTNTVLFVFDVCQFSPGLIYYDGPSSRVNLLKQLINFKEEEQERITCFFKLHPTWQEKALWKSTECNINDIFLPIDSDLSKILDNTTLFVSVNYASSPTFQAIKKGVPVIHINTTFGKKNHRWCSPIEKVLYNIGIEFAFSFEELRNKIEKILFDKHYRNIVLSQQDNLKHFIEPDTDMSLEDLARKVISDPSTIFNFSMSGKCLENMSIKM